MLTQIAPVLLRVAAAVSALALAACSLINPTAPFADPTDAGMDAPAQSGPCPGGCAAPMPMCDEAAGRCVECLAAGDCGAEAPRCAAGVCAPCERREDCGGHVGHPACDSDSGACVECTPESEATDCGGATPRCDLTERRCFQCVETADCDDGNECTLVTCSAARSCETDATGRDATTCSGSGGSGVCASGECIAHRWSLRFGGTTDDEGSSVAVDGSGNVYVTGSFRGTASFGGASLTSAGSLDIFVASYAPDGAHRWSHRFGGPSGDASMSVAVDGSGNVYVTGFFFGTANFGGADLTSAGGLDVFVASYAPDGAHRWSHRFGGPAVDSGNSVAVDGSGNIYVTGSFQGTASFGGASRTSAGGNAVFVASYTPDGAHRWSHSSGGPASDYGHSVAVDGSGNVYVTGTFGATARFGGGGLTSAGDSDIFLASYTPAGTHRWSQRFGGPSGDRGWSVAVDGSGNVYVTGTFRETVSFGGEDLTSADGDDIFVASYTSDGAHRWSQRFGGPSTDSGYSVAVDGTGNVYVTGDFYGTANFGGGTLTSAGGNDIFVASYTPDGAHRWSQRFGATSIDEGSSVAVDGSANVYVTGHFNVGVDFGGGTRISAGGADGFVFSLGP